MTDLSYIRGNSFDSSKYTSAPIPVSAKVAALKDAVFQHDAVRILNAFGEKLRQQPLSKAQLWTLLASEAMFVLEVPPSILALASRVTDEWLEIDPFAATGRAARILFAAVDEYGLNEIEHKLLPSHHELYADMAAHFGMTRKDLVDPRYVVPTGFEFRDVIRNYYRKQPIIESLGFHVANETTAPLDFGVFLETFRAFRDDYGLKSENDMILDFLLVHDDVETSHREQGVEMLQLYVGDDDALLAQAHQGVLAYMECYGRFFAELDAAVFGSARKTQIRMSA
ncbi:iron-containing redox enzyme family protein [Zavarzinia sp. CC-PAN008]|uniref:iron-containing redox enzyme family protein n=1 Tax=Zavarzinia sp. CC-PAN008 TaxID=3243332 RepID=UPI003F749D96